MKPNNYKTRLLLSILILLLFVASVGFADSGFVAIVNNEAITKKDLSEFINFMRVQMSTQYSERQIEQKINTMLPDLVDKLIEDRLILQAAYKAGIVIELYRIRQRVEQIKKKYPTEAEFEVILIKQGLSLADVELKIKEQLLMMEIIEAEIKSKIIVKPQEVTDFYNANSGEFKKPEQRLARFVIIKDAESIQKLESQLEKYKNLEAIHKDLEEVAQAYSLEITDLGWVSSGQLKDEISEIIFNSNPGRLYSYLNSSEEFYIFEVIDIRPAEAASLYDVQDEISQFLFEKKMQENLVVWLDKLRAEAYIKIKEEF